MTKQTEALKLALEVLEGLHRDPKGWWNFHVEITAIKKALATDYRPVKTYHEGKPVYVSQPEQEQSGFFSREAMRAHSDCPDEPAQPEQEPVAWMCNAFDGKVCEQSSHDECEDPIPLYTTPPKRELKSTTDMMMELADRLGELPDDVDPRAWEHLLVYAPKQKPVMEYDKEELRGTFWDTTPPQREWVDLTDEDVEIINGNTWDVREAARMASAKSKEKNT